MPGKNRILIVEDEEAIAKMIAMNLEVSNYDTQIYYNGSEAEAALSQDHDYDLRFVMCFRERMDLNYWMI